MARQFAPAWVVFLSVAFPLVATETENLNLEIVPAPGAVRIDGLAGDWDLTGGIFACGDVENAAGKYAVWFHAMYDRDNLYILARWIDPTPMNNAGSVKGDAGFNGDCLQVRIITAPDVTAREIANPDRNANDPPQARTTHVTAWRDRDRLDTVNFECGRRFNEGGIRNAKAEGVRQAFLEWSDHGGYNQEIAVPWKLLTKAGVEMKAGTRIVMTLEPNFTVSSGGRLTIKDLFKPGAAIDRIFTFTSSGCWGYATLAEKGKLTPRPVRLRDGREFAVRMEKGELVVDWTGLVKSRLPEGFKPIRVSVPENGYVSLNIFDANGLVARQLLTCEHLAKGDHDIKWDGLTTTSVRRPGKPVPAGEYKWEAIHHTGIGLRLRGWAGNSGPAPWTGWGADHGNPQACAAAGDMVYVGWGGGEGDKPLLACDVEGNIRWKNIRGGIAGAAPVASDGTTVFAFNSIAQYAAKAIYRVDARTGKYTEWTTTRSPDLTMKDLWPDIREAKDVPSGPSGLAAAGGKVFVSFSQQNVVLVVDAASGTVEKKLEVKWAGALAALTAERVFVTSDNCVLAVDVASGQSKVVVKPALGEKQWISCIAADRDGNLYLGLQGRHQVEVYGPDGRILRMIGRAGGRALSGPWTPDGMYNIAAIAVDSQGKLWAAEDDGQPRRVSVWDAKTGEFRKELFGASSYGASGAAINPKDPYVMAGQGCEWRIAPKTGKARILGTITRDGMGSSRYGFGLGGRLYLAVSSEFLHGSFPVRIFERLGDANYKFRSMLRQVMKDGPDPKKKIKVIEVWADVNGDGLEQPEEVKTYSTDLGGWIAGWYLSMTQDLSFYGSMHQVKVAGWTACGAPIYDLDKAKKIAGPENARFRGGMGANRGLGSADGKYMLYNGTYGDDHSTVDCYEIDSGRFLWTYPSNFTGVHGSHRACGPEVGMIRGAYDVVGAAKLPAPVGNIWVIPTNKGEWHVLTEKGFYLTRFFEGDPMRNVWPEKAEPGANLDLCPPGAGEEAFGGSICQAEDGKLSVQAGHVSYWNAEVVGLETIKALAGGKVVIGEDDVKTATAIRERRLQEAAVRKRLVVRKATVAFSGALEKDFAGAETAAYQKQDSTACRTAMAWDDKHLYVGWEVKDPTPWINGADAPEFLYARGDTVDLQLGTDPKAAKDRKEAALGDLRLSIGSFEGKPTAVVYRRLAAEKNPKSFSSGVTKNYVMESVVVLKDVRIEVNVQPGKGCVVEAALPLAALGLRPEAGMVVPGDFGVTHGDKAGKDTVLRTYWSNQDTGLVSDEVYELQFSPAAWGEFQFK